MRHIVPLIVLFVTVLTPVMAAETPKENLLYALSRTNDPEEQVRIYRNLADLTVETPESNFYLTKLIEKSRMTGQSRQMMEAATDLTVNYILTDKLDSAHYFIAEIEKFAPQAQRDQWCCYLEMRIFLSDIIGEGAEQAFDEKVEAYKNRDQAKESPYARIKAEYTLGVALSDRDQFEDALPHLYHALEIAKELPFREGCPYQLLTIRNLARTLNAMKETQKAYELTKGAIEIKEKYYTQYDKENRPYYSLDDFYITNYGALLINIEKLSKEEAQYYLDRLVTLSDRSNKPSHKYNRFQAQYNASAIKRNFHQALIYNDSLIYYARKIATYNLPSLFRLNSVLYEYIGENKKALENLRESYRLRDSLNQNDMQSRLDKMRIEYDVNRLNYENSQLEIRNKHILLVFMSVVLLFALILCFYLYSHLKREREVKEHMQELKTRAEESEKLKTAFINSICHEIRTPLNGIVGFAHLLVDPSIDPEERETFPAEIQTNTDQLVTLIDSMLEVANLDVSDKQLPCEEVDLAAMCRTIFQRFRTAPEAGDIEGIADIPEPEMKVQSNERYLSMVLENLLANAYKFTEQGSVTLSCVRDKTHVTIAVTDTGCGISAENHEKVFDRFIKLDSYKQGNGLGLYLCKIIVRRLSGKIFVDPDYSDGARLVVILPL